MFPFLLFLHSILRWLVLAALLTIILRAYRGWLGGRPFTKLDDTLRHSTATLGHVQLTIGFTLYAYSPLVSYFFSDTKQALQSLDVTFFGLIHALLMLTAVVLLTVGSALAKRRKEEQEKFKTIAVWFTAALLLILVAVPWPFSPLAARPLFRGF